MAVGIKRYNGSAWVDAVVKKYNGSAWVEPKVYKYTSSAWEQIYPEVAISTTETITGSATTWTYRANTYKNWKQEDAKQGNGSSYGGDSNNYGYLNLSSSKFAGYGNVNSLSSAYYTAVRGGSGSYNSNQTINFVRGNVTPTSSTSASPSGTISGRWYCETGGPGSGGTMSNKQMHDVDGGTKPSNCLDWMNGVGGKNKLYIYKSSDVDYLSIKGASKVKATYVYMTKAAAFTGLDDTGSTIHTFSNKLISCGTGTAFMSPSLVNNDAYHTMILYPSEIGMTLDEIITHRTENNLADINDNSVLLDYKKQIVIKSSEYINETNSIKIKLEYLSNGHVPEYSVDGYNYLPMTSDQVDYYNGVLPDDFDKNRHFVYIRVVNTNTDSVDFEYVHEPVFLIL